jgi:uncharacterized membrane protein YqjE
MNEPNSLGRMINASNLPTQDLIKNIGKDLKALAELEIKLAQAEMKANISAETAKIGLVAIVSALLGLNLIAVCIVLSFAPEYASMAAGILALVFFAIAGFAAWKSWNQLETNLLDETRTTLREDLQWIQTQMH